MNDKRQIKDKSPSKPERSLSSQDMTIKRIHEIYGTDLQAFFRDAKKAMLKRQLNLPDGRTELTL